LVYLGLLLSISHLIIRQIIMSKEIRSTSFSALLKWSKIRVISVYMAPNYYIFMNQ